MPQRDDLLVWIDLEMSGLESERDTILEIATLITDNELNMISEGPVVAIHQPAGVLQAMDDWNREHHTASGLVARVQESVISMTHAEGLTLDFVERHCVKRTAPLCGNSIHQDRRFLYRYMPRLDTYLHYRNIDVSTVKELVRRWYPSGAPEPPEKKHTHLALDDIRESIEELRFYRQHFFRTPPS
jgi:oligoribonuclease